MNNVPSLKAVIHGFFPFAHECIQGPLVGAIDWRYFGRLPEVSLAGDAPAAHDHVDYFGCIGAVKAAVENLTKTMAVEIGVFRVIITVEMSHSPDKRKENKESALRTMAANTEDRMILMTRFGPDDGDFADIFETTWAELHGESLIEEANKHGPIEYRLTGAGWIAGLQLTPLWDDAEFRKKAGKLSETLKRYVKGRTEDAIVPFRSICEERSLDEGFVYNAIESHLLYRLYNSFDAKWDHHGKNHVIIPRTFGLPCL